MTRPEFESSIIKEFPHIGANNARFCTKLATVKNRESKETVVWFVTNYARHNFTDYEARLKKDFSEAGKHRARSEVRPALDAVLNFWRTGEGEKPKRQ